MELQVLRALPVIPQEEETLVTVEQGVEDLLILQTISRMGLVVVTDDLVNQEQVCRGKHLVA
jgi:hypothetical protein